MIRTVAVPTVVTVILLAAGCASSMPTPRTLAQAGSVLERHVGGTWQEEGTNPDIGPVLVLKERPPQMDAGFFGVFPFPYDDAGREKLALFMGRRSAPLYVLGFSDSYTVITWVRRTNEVSQSVITALHLSVPERDYERPER